ncbi:cation diffusion facilitator family transporter [Agrococcus sp. ARC_14]|uniref:cation diffusion facilitator family transporter n=1 Tax=Agrococcus sp. ARC_14 TaxID=2919927 RepID=UPI001F0546D9|nr:cation diffusion facilitator family transporter [Agrococcus sp. ARC_14]MCH1883640.1 cation diffusion facilitator family transporter [Agrococcus sp. ARC_14]
MSGGHAHAHGAGHADASSTVRIAVAFGITAVLLLAQIVGSILTGSLALLVDTVHMLTDVAGLGVALTAQWLLRRPPKGRRTWGLVRVEVLAAAAQAAALLVVALVVVIEGVRRLGEPTDVPGPLLLVFGIVGLAGNLVSLAVLAGGRGASLNMRAAFLEVLNDAIGSIAVIAAAVAIWLWGFQQADLIASALVAALIVPRSIVLLRDTGRILLESAPEELDLDDVRAHLLEIEHVVGVHDLHASTLGTGLHQLTAHVVVEPRCFADGHAPRILDALQECAAEHFPLALEHATFQLEPPGHAAHEPQTHA